MTTQKKGETESKATEPEAMDPASKPASEPASIQSPEQSQSLKEAFTLFPKLPTEIRCKIWGFATPPPLLIRLMAWGNKSEREDTKWVYVRHGPVTSVLHVCQESRLEFLHRDGVTKSHPTYVLVHGLSADHQEHGVFVASDYDILVIASDSALHHPFISTLSSIALSARGMQYLPSTHSRILDKMQKVACLEKAMVFVDLNDEEELKEAHKWYGALFHHTVPYLAIEYLHCTLSGSLETLSWDSEEPWRRTSAVGDGRNISL